MLFESLGLLASGQVVPRSASDLVTGYANQAAGKTREVFDSALGQVLFIDEAYRWAGRGVRVKASSHGPGSGRAHATTSVDAASRPCHTHYSHCCCRLNPKIGGPYMSEVCCSFEPASGHLCVHVTTKLACAV